jgi:hypothetical protein
MTDYAIDTCIMWSPFVQQTTLRTIAPEPIESFMVPEPIEGTNMYPEPIESFMVPEPIEETNMYPEPAESFTAPEPAESIEPIE